MKTDCGKKKQFCAEPEVEVHQAELERDGYSSSVLTMHDKLGNA
jgi:hypothetical protein